jgi:hypothetical protein
MLHNYFLRGSRVVGLFFWAWLLAATTWAQAPAWTLATGYGAAATGTGAVTNSMATDANGNIFVTGFFFGQVTFGTTTLTSQGNNDFFVAKYVPATASWAWVMRGGGSGYDLGRGIAVRGNSVYITGSFTGSTANGNGVTFESAGPTGTVLVPMQGSTSSASSDLFVAKYTDNGFTATLNWTQTGGGIDYDAGYAIAVSGTSVYVTGIITNNRSNTYQVAFGGNGAAPSTVPQAGVSTSLLYYDVVVAKYTDNGSSATLGWTQVAGGNDRDYAYGIAASGTSVYVTGSLVNDRNNGYAVVFGGSGTTAGTAVQYGASGASAPDLFVAKYTDNGSSATLGWTQIAGGGAYDEGYGVAVSGSSVYVVGCSVNNRANINQVMFGGTGATAGTSPQLGTSIRSYDSDLLVAKYTDNGPSATYNWSQVGGGTSDDIGYAIAVSGPNVYVTGLLINNAANTNSVVFGGSGTTLGTATQPGASATVSYDVVVAKYTDQGATSMLNWTQIGGGPGNDYGQAIAVAGSSLYVAGTVVPAATFGSLTISAPTGRTSSFLSGLANAVLATTPPLPATTCYLYPNPAAGPATLSGASAGAAVGIFDALGRRVAIATADAHGTAALPGGLRPGLYVVRAGTGTARWVVE